MANLGKNSKISIGGTLVAEVLKVKPASYKVTTIDDSNIESEVREYVPGIVEPGEATVTVKLTPANVSRFQGYIASPSVQAIVITHADLSQQSFDGIVTEVSPVELDNTGLATCDITIQASGLSTYVTD